MVVEMNRRKTAHVAVTAAALMGAALVVALVWPEAADAALRAAAGGAAEGSGGFARFVRFIDRLASYTVPVTRSLEDAEIKLTRVWRFRD